MTEYEHHLKTYARNLRSRQTEAEEKLWHHLRRDQIGIRFYRQRPLGRYILDFYAPKAKLVLELDGSQHVDDPVQLEKDSQRDAWLLSQGLMTLRFDDRQVLLETQAVLEVIFQAVHQANVTAIPPGPPFAKGGAAPAPIKGALLLEKGEAEPLPATEGSLPFLKGGQEGFSNASIRDKNAT